MRHLYKDPVDWILAVRTLKPRWACLEDLIGAPHKKNSRSSPRENGYREDLRLREMLWAVNGDPSEEEEEEPYYLEDVGGDDTGGGGPPGLLDQTRDRGGQGSPVKEDSEMTAVGSDRAAVVAARQRTWTGSRSVSREDVPADSAPGSHVADTISRLPRSILGGNVITPRTDSGLSSDDPSVTWGGHHLSPMPKIKDIQRELQRRGAPCLSGFSIQVCA